MIDLNKLTIKKAHEAMVSGEWSAVDLAKAYLQEIEKKNKDINAYLEVFDDVIEQAKAADKRFQNGEKDNLLLGIPIAIKDNILIKGRKVGAASKVLEGYVATYDSTVAKKLKEKGVVFLGRVNMDEFAMGASTEYSAYGVTKNPLDLSRVAGGTSGGSAAAVAANMALVSLGSDTGGSIRHPSSFCGVVGFKPSYGRVSRHGLIAMTSSVDQIGPIAKNVEDAKIVYEAIAGKDEMDSTSLEALPSKPNNKKIGVYSKLLEIEGLNPSVKKNFEESVSRLKSLGYEIVSVDLPNISYSIPIYYIIVPAEISSNMARFDGVRFGAHVDGDNLLEDYLKTRGKLLGEEVRRRILIGTYVLSHGYYDAYYSKANQLIDLLKDDFRKAFEKVDAIVTPTTAGPSFIVGTKRKDPIELYLEDVFTCPANLARLSAISVPSGLSEKEKMPLGFHIVGPTRDDEIVFEIAKDFENSLKV